MRFTIRTLAATAAAWLMLVALGGTRGHAQSATGDPCLCDPISTLSARSIGELEAMRELIQMKIPQTMVNGILRRGEEVGNVEAKVVEEGRWAYGFQFGAQNWDYGDANTIQGSHLAQVSFEAAEGIRLIGQTSFLQEGDPRFRRGFQESDYRVDDMNLIGVGHRFALVLENESFFLQAGYGKAADYKAGTLNEDISLAFGHGSFKDEFTEMKLPGEFGLAGVVRKDTNFQPDGTRVLSNSVQAAVRTRYFYADGIYSYDADQGTWRKIETNVTVPVGIVDNVFVGLAYDRMLQENGAQNLEGRVLYADGKRIAKLAVTERSAVTETTKLVIDQFGEEYEEPLYLRNQTYEYSALYGMSFGENKRFVAGELRYDPQYRIVAFSGIVSDRQLFENVPSRGQIQFTHTRGEGREPAYEAKVRAVFPLGCVRGVICRLSGPQYMD